MEWYDIDYMEHLTRFERTSVDARLKRDPTYHLGNACQTL